MAVEDTTEAPVATDAAPSTETPQGPGTDDTTPPKKTLYDKMIADKLYSKSYKDFTDQFSTPEKVSKLHDYLTQKGKYDKGVAQFEKQFFSDIPSSKPVDTPAPVKKKDLSTQDSSNGSPISTQPSESFPQTDISQIATQGQQIPAPPNVPVQDAAAVSARLTQEYQAQQAKLQQQTIDNVNKMMDDFGKANPKKRNLLFDNLPQTPENKAAEARFDAENHDQSDVVDKAEKQRQQEEKDNPDFKGSLGDRLLAEGKVIHDAANKGVVNFGQGLVTAANFIAHIMPSELSLDNQGNDKLDKAKNDINGYLNSLLNDTQFSNKAGTLGIDDKTVKSLNKEPIENAVNQVANFVPAVIGSESTGGLSFYYQQAGNADSEIQDLKKSGVKISPQAENAYVQGSSLLNYLLMDRVNSNMLFSKFPSSLRNSIVGQLSADAMKDLAAKGADATADDVVKAFTNPSMTFDQKLRQFGVNAVKSYAKTTADLSALATADFGVKALANKENEDNTGGKQTFQQSGSDLMKQFGNIIFSVAPAFTAMGAGHELLANPGLLFHGSPYSNLVTDRLQQDPSPENVQAIKNDLETIGKKKNWSEDDIVNTQKAVDVVADVASKMPRDVTPEVFRAGVDLITGRRQLQDVLAETQARKVDLDPALQAQVGPFEDLLNAKIDQANDKLSSLISKKPFTYYEYQGEYFKKQVDGEPIPITKARYDLEGIENDHKPEAEQTNLIPEGLADKKGNPIPPKDDTTSESKPAKAPVPEPAKEPQPTAEAKPVKANNEVVENKEPEPKKEVIEKPEKQPLRPEKPIKPQGAVSNFDSKDLGEKIPYLKGDGVNSWDILDNRLDWFNKAVENLSKDGTESGAYKEKLGVRDAILKYIDENKYKENANPDNQGAELTPKTESDGKDKTKAQTEIIKKTDETGDEGRQELLKKDEETGETDNSPVFSHQGEAERHWVENETDPDALASRYHQESFDISNTADYKEHKIHEYLGNSKINASDFTRFGDDNLLKGDPDFKRRWIDTKNTQSPIDSQAQEMSSDHTEITPQDIIDYVTKYRGADDFKEKSKTDLQKNIESRYEELTGKKLTDKRAEESYNKQIAIHKESVLADDARDIIEKEGITKANIDKMADQFKGFPYSEEDFDNVKRYLDEHENKSPQPESNNEAEPVGAAGSGVGEKQSEKSGTASTGTKPGELTETQQKVAKQYNQRISVVGDELTKKLREIQNKLASLSKKNNLFGDDEIAKNNPQQTLLDTEQDLSDDNVKAIMAPLHAEAAELEAELRQLEKDRDNAVRTAHQQTTAFDTQSDDGQTGEVKNTVDDADKLVQAKNSLSENGKLRKTVKESLNDAEKKMFDELRNKLKRNIRQEMTGSSDDSGEHASASFNHELYSNGIALTNLYFKAGVTGFADYAQEMIADMGEDVIPYLSSFYEGAKRLPGQTARFDSTDTVDYLMAKLTEPSEPEQAFVDRVKSELTANNKLSIVHLEGIADEVGLKTDTRVGLQEYVERALVEMARDIVDNPLFDDREKFNEIMNLYNRQPSLNQRNSTKTILQQYSTPLPYAFAAGSYVNGIKPNRVYDPTAGTGMLTIAFDPSNVIVNEIDPTRIKILQQLGFEPKKQDAVEDPAIPRVPGMVINPPFGNAQTSKTFGGYSFSKLDQIIPITALNNLKSAGRAIIIIGGHNEYDKHGALTGSDFKFFNFLHHFYNVTDVINVDGNLYAKQGASYPTRLILINGRKEVADGYAPTYNEAANKPVKSFEDLFNRIQERISNDEDPSVLQSRVDVQPHPGNADDGTGTAGVQTKETGRPGAVSGTKDIEADRTGVESKGAGDTTTGRQAGTSANGNLPAGDSPADNAGGQLADVPVEIAKYAPAAEEGSIGPERSGEFIPSDRPLSVDRPTADQLVKNDKVPYSPASRLSEAGSVIPSNMAYETEQNLKELEQLYGPIDTWVANELGYADLDDLNNSFFAEQIDAIGLAIHQMKQGKGMIVGDMTGIGKGRVAAGLIRWVSQQGEVPTFFTENADLFTDIYRDLHGIGSGHLVPFIINDPSSDRDANIKRNGNVVYKAGTIKDKRQFFETKKLPRGTKVILSTYSQINSEKQVLKRNFISHMTKGGYMFLDESHNVAGDSNSGKFFQDLLAESKAATFFSATYAKRADNMPVYALKTSMSDANMSSDALVGAILSGGNALQEIVASQLVKAGQMIRRERDFEGVVNTFVTLGHDKDGNIDETGKKQRELADQVIDVCNAIIDFEQTHVLPELSDVRAKLQKEGRKLSQTKSKQLSVANTPFASKMFNIVNQMLFSIKAPELANRAIEHLKNNRKPVISFNSTMESFIKNGGYKPGDEINDVSFSASLKKGLDNTLKYRVEYPNGETEVNRLDIADMTDEARTSWNSVIDLIKSASADMSISPIDNITEILEKAGYHVGEITGRGMKLRFNDDHTSAVVEAIGKRDTSGMIHDFNNGNGGGKADVLLLNASGATGFSMHADKSFRDQRERVMVNGQMELDINKEIQKRGRIDRTNQVRRGAFDYLNTAIPAETRLSMMFSDKLKKLQANTTSSQKSKANDVATTDFLNEYGDQVMTDYLRNNPDIYNRLFQGADPAGLNDAKSGKPVKATEGIARKTTGRAALLKVAEQEKFYDEVSQAYNDYIDYLNSTDQNTLAVKSINLEAKPISEGVFIEGKHTQSPFGQDSILQKVEANVLRKPLTKQELEDAIDENLKGKTPREKANDLIKGVREYYEKVRQRSLDRYNENYNKRIEGYEKKYAKEPEMLAAAKKDEKEQFKKNIEYVNGDINTHMGKMEAMFRYFEVGSEQMVPSSISGTETKYTKGIFLGFSQKDKYTHNPYAPSNVIMKFAVLDGKRTISVSASQQEFVNALYAGKEQLSVSELKQMGNLRNEWDSKVKDSKPRETRYIVTGNILQAFKPNLGQLVSYTTSDGHINKGILLPKDFNPASEGKMTNAVSMFEKIMNMKNSDVFVASTGDFQISKILGRSEFFKIEVPKSTKQGGKYFKSDAILDQVEYGEFETRNGVMVAQLPSYRLMDLLKVLERDYNMKFNSGVEMRNIDGSDDNEADDQNSVDYPKVSNSTPLKPRDSGELKYHENDFVKGKNTERVQAENRLPTDSAGELIPIKKLPDMISDLAKGLNVKIFYAKSKRSGAAGSYNPASGGIKISSVNNLDVAIHEVGHSLDDVYKLFDTIPSADHSDVMDELQWFADRGGSNPPGTLSRENKMEYLKREGVAEFVRAYAINRAQAFAHAPKFYTHFESTVPEDVRQVVETFGEDYLRYINSTALDGIMANVEEAPKEKQSAYRKLLTSLYGNKEGKFQLTPFDKLQIRMTNSGKGFNKAFQYMNELAGSNTDNILPEANANLMARLFAGVDAKVGSFFKDGLVNAKNEPIIDSRSGQRMNMDWLYNAFDTTSEETLKQDQALTIGYLFASRTIEKAMQFDRPHNISGISAAGDKSDTDVAIQFLMKEFGRDLSREQKIRVMEGARRYQLWADTMLKYMVEKGRMSRSTYREIKEKNLEYVAFLPVQENSPGIENSFDNVAALTRMASMGSVKNVIREMTGSTMYKRHPYISLLQNTAAMVKEADRNDVLQSFIEPMANSMRNMGEGKVNPFANVMMEVTAAEKMAGKPVITVFVNGNPKYYMFSEDAKDVYNYVKGLTKLPKLPKVITAIPNMIRFTATHFPVFAKNHFIRSTFNRLVISRTGSGLGSFVKDRDGESALYKLFGGDQTGFWLSNRVDYYKLQNQVIKNLSSTGKGIVLNPVELAKKGWAGYEKLLQKSDLSNRMAEFRSAYEMAKKPKIEGGLGYDEYNANLWASYQSRDLLDGAVAGTWMRFVNLMIPFANVEVQGLKRNIKAATEGDVSAIGLYAVRLALYTLLPTLLMRLLAKTGNYEEDYDNLPAYQRDLGWNFKLPGMESWIYIPKPYDTGLLASGMDRAIGKFGSGDDNSFTDFDNTLYQNLLLMKPEMAAGPFSTIVEPIANYSFFKQGPIVPRYEEDKILSLRKHFNDASRAGKAASWVLSPLYKEGDSIDPRYIDNMMQSMFSYYGETGMDLSDIGSSNARHKFGLKTTGFVKDQASYGDARVEKLYNVAKELGLTESKAIKGLSGMLRDYYNSTDPEERKQLHQKVMDYAKQTYKEWMSEDIYKEKIESRGQKINFN